MSEEEAKPSVEAGGFTQTHFQSCTLFDALHDGRHYPWCQPWNIRAARIFCRIPTSPTRYHCRSRSPRQWRSRSRSLLWRRHRSSSPCWHDPSQSSRWRRSSSRSSHRCRTSQKSSCRRRTSRSASHKHHTSRHSSRKHHRSSSPHKHHHSSGSSHPNISHNSLRNHRHESSQQCNKRKTVQVPTQDRNKSSVQKANIQQKAHQQPPQKKVKSFIHTFTEVIPSANENGGPVREQETRDGLEGAQKITMPSNKGESIASVRNKVLDYSRTQITLTTAESREKIEEASCYKDSNRLSGSSQAGIGILDNEESTNAQVQEVVNVIVEVVGENHLETNNKSSKEAAGRPNEHTAEVVTHTSDRAAGTADKTTDTADKTADTNKATDTTSKAADTSNKATNTLDKVADESDKIIDIRDRIADTSVVTTVTSDKATDTSDEIADTSDKTTDTSDMTADTSDKTTDTSDKTTDTSDMTADTSDKTTDTSDMTANTSDMTANTSDKINDTSGQDAIGPSGKKAIGTSSRGAGCTYLNTAVESHQGADEPAHPQMPTKMSDQEIDILFCCQETDGMSGCEVVFDSNFNRKRFGSDGNLRNSIGNSDFYQLNTAGSDNHHISRRCDTGLRRSVSNSCICQRNTNVSVTQLSANGLEIRAHSGSYESRNNLHSHQEASAPGCSRTNEDGNQTVSLNCHHHSRFTPRSHRKTTTSLCRHQRRDSNCHLVVYASEGSQETRHVSECCLEKINGRENQEVALPQHESECCCESGCIHICHHNISVPNCCKVRDTAKRHHNPYCCSCRARSFPKDV